MSTEVKPEAKSKFKDWYDKNRTKLSESRKIKYRTDPEHRQLCLDRAAARRKALSEVKGPEGSLTLADAAKLLGVGQWTVSSWRSKGYFPEGDLYPKHMELLKRIQMHFKQYPRKQALLHTDELDQIVASIKKDW